MNSTGRSASENPQGPEQLSDEGGVCTACNRGSLMKNRVRRSDGFVVFLGFVFLVVAVLGLLGSGVSTFAFGFLSSQAKRPSEEIRAELQELKVPDATIEKLLAPGNDPVAASNNASEAMNGLNSEQQAAVFRAMCASLGRRLPTGQMFASSLVGLVISVVLGVVGFLFIRKRWVLQCTECRAVLPAS